MTHHLGIEEAAAAWLVKKSDRDWCDETERAFDDWMNESFAHAAACWRLEHAYAQLDRLASLPIETGNRHKRPRFPAMAGYGALAATIVAFICASWLLVGDALLQQQPETVTYSTGYGQISEITLADGSQISLDRETAVRVGSGPDERKVWVDRGRVFFEVVHDPDRPFRVDAGAGQIRVLGTSFVVSRESEMVTTSVLNGKISLKPVSRAVFPALTLEKGDVGIVTNASIRSSKRDLTQLKNSLAWRDGMVIFEDTSVVDAIAEFNRYNQRKLVIRIGSGRETRIGGKFRLGNIDGFARLMQQAYGLRIDVVPAAQDSAPKG